LDNVRSNWFYVDVRVHSFGLLCAGRRWRRHGKSRLSKYQMNAHHEMPHNPNLTQQNSAPRDICQVSQCKPEKSTQLTVLPQTIVGSWIRFANSPCESKKFSTKQIDVARIVAHKSRHCPCLYVSCGGKVPRIRRD